MLAGFGLSPGQELEPNQVVNDARLAKAGDGGKSYSARHPSPTIPAK